MDVYSVKFDNCRYVYPLRCIRPSNKFKYDEQPIIESVVQELNEANAIIDDVVLDNPKRSIFRCALNHASTFACEYCESHATHYTNDQLTKDIAANVKKIDKKCTEIQNRIDYLNDCPGTVSSKHKDDENVALLLEILTDLKQQRTDELKKQKRRHLVWPATTSDGTPRTYQRIKNITDAIERQNNDFENESVDSDGSGRVMLTKADKKGFIGTSVFLNQPNFHFISNIPCEYMHALCICLVKRMLELTFCVGEKRERCTKRKLSSPNTYNIQIQTCQVPREFSRRGRNLDLGVMKALEYRNVILFFFPLILNCIPPIHHKERRLWLCLAFITRACVIPNIEFEQVDENMIDAFSNVFYTDYQDVYGRKNCTYSLHVIATHLLQIRGRDPLTETSAFKFENYYSEMKNMYHPGTTSTMKQIVQNSIMKRLLDYHCCEKTLFFKTSKQKNQNSHPRKEDNSLIYVYDNNKHNMYKIVNIPEDDPDNLICVPQGKFRVTFPLLPDASWDNVGVYRIGPTSSRQITIPRARVTGKVIKVSMYLITCPSNILREQ